MNHSLALILSLALTACHSNDTVSWVTEYEARQQGLANAQANATRFRQVYYPQLALRMRGDSTVRSDCKFGDGWVSIQLIPHDSTSGPPIEIKCSTVSVTIGCLTAQDFYNLLPVAGPCNDRLPDASPIVKK